MSILQVVGSSRISNTVYLGVASVYWTIFITTVGWQVDLSVETALLLVTPPAGIAALLWSLRLEELMIVRFLVFVLSRYPRGKMIRYHMGFTSLFLQPWKEEFFETRTIHESLTQEIRRTLRTVKLREEMATLYQLFWLLVSIPGIWLLLLFAAPISTQIINIVMIVVFLLSFFGTLVRKRLWPFRILSIAYTNWVLDSIQKTERLRNAFDSDTIVESYPLSNPQYFPQYESESLAYRDTMEPWLKEIEVLSNREDWYGFEKRFDSLVSAQKELHHRKGFSLHLNSLVNDIIWSFKRKKVVEPYPKDATVSLEQARPAAYIGTVKFYVLDSLNEIQRVLEPLSPSGIDQVRIFIKKWELLRNWDDIYGIISRDIILHLQQSTIQVFAQLPFYMHDKLDEFKEVCKFRDPNKQVLIRYAILCFHRSVDRDLIRPEIVFRAANRWGVMPSEYIDQCSPKVRPLILEMKSDIPADELIPVVRKIILNEPKLDVNKVASNIARYKGESGFRALKNEIANVVSAKPGAWPSNNAKKILERLNGETK